MIKVQNMKSNRGNIIANQFIIITDKGTVFQSYNSIIAIKNTPFTSYTGGKIVLDSKYWDYSKTTGKYRNQFLGETKAETQAKIDSGEYLLARLN